MTAESNPSEHKVDLRGLMENFCDEPPEDWLIIIDAGTLINWFITACPSMRSLDYLATASEILASSDGRRVTYNDRYHILQAIGVWLDMFDEEQTSLRSGLTPYLAHLGLTLSAAKAELEKIRANVPRGAW